ncbi:6,7-dimethyl-8-ribityllumazine synthase [Coleophoma cylindrospora]|uniref:6,7-dimethyl-8-ribityllumazine synthase n=1 Tax=Coleophoma cylindrospora TaxID=1849047 RepID=A0A3D8R1I2_9HELO|nr:6,7-dimethyl-8-ribityllumazine synthase [Coleophoma cylindrospora]
MASLKGPGEAQKLDGSALRIGIVHARWNTTIIEPLLKGTKKTLLASGVQESNIVVQSVPGSWELPIACSKLYSASQVQSTSSSTLGAGDLLGGSTSDLTSLSTTNAASTAPFDAVIAIGVLIKGETMHFEYIAESVSHGLMRVQLDTGVPLIFGLLTVLNEDQALARAGVSSGSHNHGEDWGAAAVELGVKRREWAAGKIS